MDINVLLKDIQTKKQNSLNAKINEGQIRLLLQEHGFRGFQSDPNRTMGMKIYGYVFNFLNDFVYRVEQNYETRTSLNEHDVLNIVKNMEGFKNIVPNFLPRKMKQPKKEPMTAEQKEKRDAYYEKLQVLKKQEQKEKGEKREHDIENLLAVLDFEKMKELKNQKLFALIEEYRQCTDDRKKLSLLNKIKQTHDKLEERKNEVNKKSKKRNMHEHMAQIRLRKKRVNHTENGTTSNGTTTGAKQTRKKAKFVVQQPVLFEIN